MVQLERDEQLGDAADRPDDGQHERAVDHARLARGDLEQLVQAGGRGVGPNHGGRLAPQGGGEREGDRAHEQEGDADSEPVGEHAAEGRAEGRTGRRAGGHGAQPG